MVAVSLKKFFFQAEDGIRDPHPSRGLGDVYKRQVLHLLPAQYLISVLQLLLAQYLIPVLYLFPAQYPIPVLLL